MSSVTRDASARPTTWARCRGLCAEELELAGAFGAPRALGIARRACGLIEGGEPGLELLRQATATLARSHATLENARALADLGPPCAAQAAAATPATRCAPRSTWHIAAAPPPSPSAPAPS
jgi:hypothetical protein